MSIASGVDFSSRSVVSGIVLTAAADIGQPRVDGDLSSTPHSSGSG